MSQILKVKKVHPAAHIPRSTSLGAAGFDLAANVTHIIPPFGREKISTGIAVEFPDGCYGRVAGRSGITWNLGILIGGGVIDPDFRGEISVIAFNTTNMPWEILPGDRVAQLIVERYCPTTVEVVDELTPSVRDTRGMGSSGM